MFHCWKDICGLKLPRRVAISENDRLYIYSLWKIGAWLFLQNLLCNFFSVSIYYNLFGSINTLRCGTKRQAYRKLMKNCKCEMKFLLLFSQNRKRSVWSTPVSFRVHVFAEVREHGVGYYAFSTDEETRKEQQERLNRLRQATKAARSRAEDADAERRAALAERLKKVRQRKRLRAGLPLVDKDEEEEEAAEKKAKEEEEERAKSAEAGEGEESQEFGPMPASDEAGEKTLAKKVEQKKPIVRPWDLGKIGVQLGPGTLA
jgi:hypothetical protein